MSQRLLIIIPQLLERLTEISPTKSLPMKRGGQTYTDDDTTEDNNTKQKENKQKQSSP